MSSDAQTSGDGTQDPLTSVTTEWFDTLRHPRRVRVLETLRTATAPVTLADLTTALLDRQDESTDRQRVRISLVHNHLPRLAECGVLEWDGETASLRDDSPVPLDSLPAVLDLCGGEDEVQHLDALVHPVRMRLCSILHDQDRPISVEQLAAELAAHEPGSISTQRDAKIALHHAHLPAMEEAGALEFDRESGLVRRADQPVPLVAP